MYSGFISCYFLSTISLIRSLISDLLRTEIESETDSLTNDELEESSLSTSVITSDLIEFFFEREGEADSSFGY